MITDAELTFSDDQAVTATAISENVYDMGPLDSNNVGIFELGTGRPLHVYILLTETMDDAGDDSTVTVTLEMDSAVGLDATPTVVYTFPVFSATTAAGALRTFTLPQDLTVASGDRYVGLRYTVANGDLSAGEFRSGIVQDLTVVKQYASGYEVDSI